MTRGEGKLQLTILPKEQSTDPIPVSRHTPVAPLDDRPERRPHHHRSQPRIADLSENEGARHSGAVDHPVCPDNMHRFSAVVAQLRRHRRRWRILVWGCLKDTGPITSSDPLNTLTTEPAVAVPEKPVVGNRAGIGMVVRVYQELIGEGTVSILPPLNTRRRKCQLSEKEKP